MGRRLKLGYVLPLSVAGLSIIGCTDPAPVTLEIRNPCDQATVRDADTATVTALELDTGERWSGTFSKESGSGELPEIPVGARVSFDVSLSQNGEVYAWGAAQPFEMTASDNVVPVVQPSRVGAFTRPHAPESPGLCAGYNEARVGGKILKLAGGDLLHIGGYSLGEELSYVRGVERWSARDNSISSSGTLEWPRVDDSATQLSDGSWVLTGGRFEAVQGSTGARETSYFTLAIHVSADGEIEETPGILQAGRAGHVAQQLSDGRVWLLGGRGGNGAVMQTEIYDPETKSSAPGPTLVAGRWNAGVIALDNDTAVLVGGENESGLLDSIEIVRLSDDTGSVSPLTLSEARTRPTVIENGNTFWIVGGGTVAGDDFNLGKGSLAIDGLERGGTGFVQRCTDTALALKDGRFLGASLQDDEAAYLAGGYDENGVLLKSFIRVSFEELSTCSPDQGSTLAELGEARAYLGAAMLESSLMVFGGGQSRQSGDASSSNRIEIYRSAR